MGPCVRRDDRDGGQSVPLARHVALGITGHASAAHLGSNCVNLATNANANIAR